MWPESSSVNAVNLAKNITTIPEISNFSQGITFLAHPVEFLQATGEYSTKIHLWQLLKKVFLQAGYLPVTQKKNVKDNEDNLIS